MRLFALVAILAIGVAVSGPVHAAFNLESVSSHEIDAVKAKIKAKDYKGAIRTLTGYVDSGVVNADIFNLLGFSLRKSGDLVGAASYYQRALAMDPNHKGALEYQGELFLQTGNRAGAEANLARLRRLCPTGCEELEDLEAAIKAAKG